MTTQKFMKKYIGLYDQKIVEFANKLKYFVADNAPSKQRNLSTLLQSYGSIIDVHALHEVGTRGTQVFAKTLK